MVLQEKEVTMGCTEVYYGDAKGKTTLALGQSLKAAAAGKSVIIIQFLKGKDVGELDYLENLQMDFKIFRFGKLDKYYEDLTSEEKEEENMNIQNGVNYARKVIATSECDFLVLDEILGLLDIGIITEDTLLEILKKRGQDMHIILTGRKCPDRIKAAADDITVLTSES